MEPQISRLRREAKEFAAKGGNETLFWAGRMSELVGRLLRADLKCVSETATLLGQVKREYDDRIISSANVPGHLPLESGGRCAEADRVTDGMGLGGPARSADSMILAIGILSCATEAVENLFNGFPETFSRRFEELNQWFNIENAATVGTDKVILLKPREAVREALATALAVGGKVNSCGCSLRVGDDLRGRIDVSHIRDFVLPNAAISGRRTKENLSK